MDNEKKVLGASTLAVIALIIIVVGATYAFFKGVDAANTDTPLEVTTNTVDSLIFNIDTDITMVADMSNFTEGKGNRVGEAHATATLKANNKTNSASNHYYLYFDIKENGLSYTTEEETPELILQVNGPDGEVTEISGLNYVTVEDGQGNEVTGFDITEVQDFITIASNIEITATSTTVDDWDVKVVLVNLSEDQSANGGKKFNGELIIQKNAVPRNLYDYIKNEVYTGVQGENNIYLHDLTLQNGAGDNSYRYAGVYEDVNNYVCFGYDGDGECPLHNKYRIIGLFNNQIKLIKADYTAEEHLGNNSVATSVNIKAFAYYKGDSTSVIKYYYWNGIYQEKNNDWSKSSFNINQLNGIFVNTFSNKWRNKILTTNWIIGGNTENNIINKTAANVYNAEIKSPATSATYSAKIGLMYVSDYMYGASPTYWTYVGGYYDYTNADGCYGCTMDYRVAKAYNWLCLGGGDWTITKNSSNSEDIFLISREYGNIGNRSTGVYYSDHGGMRPTFYLDSSIMFTNGDGSHDNPYMITD